MVMTMADSEREELEQLIEDWNASRLDMFTISKPDANLEFSGNMRFYFQEPGARDTKVSTKVLRVSSSDTTEDVMKVLVSKFHPDMKMLTVPNYSLYEVHETGSEAHKLELDQRPLYVQLYWQQYDRDGRFLLKSEDDKMTQKLFEDEESARNPDKRNSKPRQSKRGGKNKKKNAQEGNDPKSLAKALYEDKPATSFTRSKSNPEIVMKIQRKKKLEDRLKKIQDPETSGGGGGPLRIFAESLQPENPYKTILCASNDTTETVLKDALEKYEVPPEEMDQYCLTMVTIAPGNHSDPESSSGIKERVVPDKDFPAAIAASWPESSGELRFYLKKKENMPKRKQQQRKRHDEPPGRAGARLGPLKAERGPPATKETTFNVTEHSPTEKEPSSPAVHIVDVARDLPATLEFRESGEDAFFAVVVSEVNGSAVNFKLAPTFTLYMCCRYRLSPKFWPDFPPNKRRDKVMMTAKKVANMMWQTVKEKGGMPGHLAFWMANSSEFLHFLKQDMELSTMTEESQKILAHTTQQAFRSLVQCIKAELQSSLPAFFDPSEESELDEHGGSTGDEKVDPMEGYHSTERSFKVRQYGPHGQPLGVDQWLGKRKRTSRPVLGDVLHTLKSAMALLRRCRVNPALTIQLFSQVFHFINMWLFNRVVLEPQLRLCTRAWGVKLRQRLERLQTWAESQGLELAAECHLARISQAALLLQIPKQDSTAISSHCYKLNSLQLRQLLELYQPERDEPEISLELIEKAVSVAESTADEIARSEGQEVRLEEEPDLQLPFLLPDDGYSSEKIRGVPPGLKEFLDPLITPGLCRLTIQPKASGLWTVHFKIPPVGLESSPPPEVIKISINKGNKGMGVSIVAAKGVGQEHYGIYVKEVIDGGPAALDGRLKPGDQIMDVNGESLVGVQQEDAVKILIKAGSMVHMTVSKKAGYQNGLVDLLSKATSNNKVESPNRTPENRNLSPLPLKKEPPRAPPRYRLPQDSAQRSPTLNTTLNTSVQSESDAKQLRPEPPPKRRSPYDGQYNEWKTQIGHDGAPEKPLVQAKPVVEYKVDEAPPARKPVKAGVPLPYGNPLDIQRRQKEMQQRKGEDERREQEILERERISREEAERLERMKREEQARREQEEREQLERQRAEREQQERLRIEKEQQERLRIEREQQERLRIEREQQERLRIEREQQERMRIEREQQERMRIEREQQERLRIEKEQQERQRKEREEMERKRKEDWERKERDRIEREELERKRQEEWKKQEQERMERDQREKEEREKRLQEENAGLDEMTRRERELEMMLEQKRREKERRLKELQLQIQREEEEAERMEQEFRERLRREREERKEASRAVRPATGNTQVHYVNEQTKGNENDDHQREVIRNEDMRSNRPADYGKRGPMAADESKNLPPVEYSRRPPLPSEENRGDFVPVKRPPLPDTREDSFDMDPAEIERQFQQRLAQESSGKSEVDGGFVKVIRVPVQQDSWEARGNARDLEDRPRARVDWQREEDERSRKEQQWRREQDEQLVRDFQQNETFRQQPAGAVAEPVHPRPVDWEKDEELRRQREEDDRLREARANQLRNRIIERPEDDEDVRDTSYNGRTRRVKFASVRTEIIQPSPDAEVAKPGVKFVHDGKVEDSDDEEFPRPPPPVDEEDAPPPPLPPQDQVEYYQRPPPPPKPQNLISNGGANPPGFRENEHIARVRARVSDEGYATYPGRQQHNNNYPVPKPCGVSREAEQFGKSPSPDQAKLPFKDKMKVFNETTPPKRQTGSKWDQRWVNGDSL